MAYDNTNTGALFKNKDKETDKHPDYNGQINVEGTEYWLAAWLKKSKAGQPYMSLAVKPKDQKAKPTTRKPADDSEIPF